jgi:hypothetical protein
MGKTTVSELKVGVDQLKVRVDQLKGHVDERFEQVDRLFAELRAEMREDGERTRRHFDIVAERMETNWTLLAEGFQADHGRLEDHERRLDILEKRRR